MYLSIKLLVILVFIFGIGLLIPFTIIYFHDKYNVTEELKYIRY